MCARTPLPFCWCVISVALGCSNSTAEDIVTAIQFSGFWTAAGATVSNTPSPPREGTLGGDGGSLFQLKHPGHKDTYVSIGIFGSVDVAKEEFRNECVRINIAPNPDPVNFGDEMKNWLRGDHGGGAILYRRGNVFVHIVWFGSKEEGLAFAKAIDDILVGNHTFVSKGAFASLPKIAGLPPFIEITKGETKTINVTFEGLGNGTPSVSIDSPGYLTNTIIPDGTTKITLSATAENLNERTVQIRAVSATAVTAKADLLVKPK